MAAFANYGFPESHSVSFAYLVYASSWIKFHEPAAFCAALLNAQPMGFWSPHTLVQDARRHGVRRAHARPQRLAGDGDAASRAQTSAGRSPCGSASARCAASAPSWPSEIEAERGGTGRTRRSRTWSGGCRRSTSPSSRRWPRPGVFGECFGLDRREALWAVGAVVAVAARPAGRHRHRRRGADACPGMDAGGGCRRRPVGHRRLARRPPDPVPARRARPSSASSRRPGLWDVASRDSRSLVAGVVTHRQRPMTAQGTTFLNLEDETGLINVVVSKGCWARFRTRRPRGAGDADPRPPGAHRGRDQHRRRTPRPAAGAATAPAATSGSAGELQAALAPRRRGTGAGAPGDLTADAARMRSHRRWHRPPRSALPHGRSRTRTPGRRPNGDG